MNDLTDLAMKDFGIIVDKSKATEEIITPITYEFSNLRTRIWDSYIDDTEDYTTD